MSAALALVRLLPARPLGRAALTLLELSLAALLLSGSVIAGHELREWRAWYGDPSTLHPWAPTPRPSPTGIATPAEPRLP